MLDPRREDEGDSIEALPAEDGRLEPRRFGSAREFYAWAAGRIWATGRIWLFPVLLVLMIVGLFLNVFTGYNVLPAIYSLIP